MSNNINLATAVADQKKADAQAVADNQAEAAQQAVQAREDENRRIDDRARDERERLDRRMDEDRRLDDQRREREEADRREEDERSEQRQEEGFKPLDENQGLALADEATIDRAQAGERKALEERQAARDKEIAATTDPEARQNLMDAKARDYHETNARLKDEKSKSLAETARVNGDGKMAARSEALGAEAKTHRERAQAVGKTNAPAKVAEKPKAEEKKAEAKGERNFAHERAEARVDNAQEKHKEAGSPEMPKAQQRQAAQLDGKLQQVQQQRAQQQQQQQEQQRAQIERERQAQEERQKKVLTMGVM